MMSHLFIQIGLAYPVLSDRHLLIGIFWNHDDYVSRRVKQLLTYEEINRNSFRTKNNANNHDRLTVARLLSSVQNFGWLVLRLFKARPIAGFT